MMLPSEQGATVGCGPPGNIQNRCPGIAKLVDRKITRDECLDALEAALQAAVEQHPSQHIFSNLRLEAKWNTLVVIEAAKGRGPP